MKSSGLFSEYRISFFVTVTVSASLLRPLTGGWILAGESFMLMVISVRRKTRKSLILQGVTADFKWRRSSRCRILCG